MSDQYKSQPKKVETQNLHGGKPFAEFQTKPHLDINTEIGGELTETKQKPDGLEEIRDALGYTINPDLINIYKIIKGDELTDSKEIIALVQNLSREEQKEMLRSLKGQEKDYNKKNYKTLVKSLWNNIHLPTFISAAKKLSKFSNNLPDLSPMNELKKMKNEFQQIKPADYIMPTMIAGGAVLGMTLGQIYNNSQTPVSQINPDITPIESIQTGPVQSTPPMQSTLANEIPNATPNPKLETQKPSEQSPSVESDGEILRQIQEFGNKHYQNSPGNQEQKVIDKINESVKPQTSSNL